MQSFFQTFCHTIPTTVATVHAGIMQLATQLRIALFRFLDTYLPTQSGYIRSNPKSSLGLLAFISYLALVRSLRWRQYNAIHKQYQKKYEQGKLTPEDAQKIIKPGMGYDMPFVLGYALSFALFKTYGVPSISKILKGTKELSSKEGISKRYTDTSILISTWIACPISGKTDPEVESNRFLPKFASSDSSVELPEDDPRAMIALARVNWLHSKYPITNDDYLYTLALFAFEPETWAKRYGWRELSPLEREAYYIYWAEIGRRMGIKDIPTSAKEFKEWVEDFESRVMVTAESNHHVANYTLEELIYVLPETFGIKSFAKRVSITLLDDRVRVAMMYPEQPPIMHYLVTGSLLAMAYFQRYLCLPRIWSQKYVDPKMPAFAKKNDANGSSCPYPHVHSSAQANRNGIANGLGAEKDSTTLNQDHLPRMHPLQFTQRPWYKPEPKNFLERAQLSLALWAGLYEERPSKELRSDGYRLEELGPLKFERVGNEETIRMAEELQQRPITGAWARG
ncbi:hypothetical protein D9758_003422 [Tetrapyrgos nigripes]|uniref:ER-bound oxygenase mpaB/mpaB'/Rubber oxygenase catalytic domain-containing protein n=1 Tax=Tetrapyrgos nigripes TaxID=182062 RepID=A0A8H5LW48_9AGAR|nr:hypothetical protein D9758_003422 [Tetrapyrgos nigripes]